MSTVSEYNIPVTVPEYQDFEETGGRRVRAALEDIWKAAEIYCNKVDNPYVWNNHVVQNLAPV